MYAESNLSEQKQNKVEQQRSSQGNNGDKKKADKRTENQTQGSTQPMGKHNCNIRMRMCVELCNNMCE